MACEFIIFMITNQKMPVKNPHKLPHESGLTHVIDNDLVRVYFYDNVIIAEIKEGRTANYKTGFATLVEAVNVIKPRPWVYISNRINNYHADPKGFKYLRLAPYIKGAAIVVPEGTKQSEMELGANYLKKPFAVFTDIQSAYEWALKLLAQPIRR